MYSLIPTPTFKRDLKRLSKKHWPINELKEVVNFLATRTNTDLLSKRYADHAFYLRVALGRGTASYMLTVLREIGY